MERREAIIRLNELIGQDLHSLAEKYEITVVNPDGHVNKGWAGHVFERHLGLQLNSAQSPNFGSWELKSIPLKHLATGALSFKETMAITMIDEYHVKQTPFAASHLLSKLRKLVVVARVVGPTYKDPTYVHSVVQFDLNGPLYNAVQEDYEAVRACLNDPNRGFSQLTGSMGRFIQPRTKGPGHGSITRAFYARPCFLAQFIDLSQPLVLSPTLVL